jgi:tRNA threonylcarbamoyladenosine biosynthesis protein TsaE
MMDELGHEPIVKNLLWPDEAATQLFAAALARQPALGNAIVELRGDLGAGKTTLVRHLLRALGVQGRVKSPTYAVVEPYELANLNIWHFDFYRFQDPREWTDAGFRDIFSSPGLKLAEWPEKAAGFMPPADLVIELQVVDEDARRVSLTAQSAIGLALLKAANPGPPSMPVNPGGSRR